MKNNKLIKVMAAIILSILILAAAISVNAEQVSDPQPITPTENGPRIISQNIAYQGAFNLCYAIDAATVAGGSVSLFVYDSEMNYIASYITEEKCFITPVGSSEIEVYVLITAPVATKDMGDIYYVQAIDGEGNASGVKKYSVAEYLLEMLYDNGFVNAEEGTKQYNQKLFFEKLLEVGALAQTVLINDELEESEAAEPLVTSYKYVRVVDGTANGYATGAFAAGDNATIGYLGGDSAFFGWEIKYFDGSSEYLNGNVLTVTDHAVVVPYSSNAADFEDGLLSTAFIKNYFYINGSAILAENAESHEPITKYSVENDPIKAANKVLKVVCTGETTQSAGHTKVEVSNDNQSGNTYIFETKIYISEATWTGDVTQIHFVNSSIANLVSFRIYTQQGSDSFSIIQNNSGGSGTEALVSGLPRKEWVSLRIEWYKGDSAENTRAKIYVGIADGALSCVADAPAYLAPTFTSELSQVRIAHQRTNASTVYFDDIALFEIDKAYTREE